MEKIRAWAVKWGLSDTVTIHAPTQDKAKAFFWQEYKDICRGYRDGGYTDIRAKLIGEPVESEEFKRTCKMRGMDLKIGQRVRVEGEECFILDSNDYYNFDVYFPKTSKIYAGMKMNVHPADIQVLVNA